MKKLELIIPSYNEASNIPPLLERVAAAAEEAGMSSKDFTLLLVENGSTDHSLAVMEEAIEKKGLVDLVKIIRVPKNRGYGFGIMTGVRAADAEVIAWTHADLQCDPINVFKAYEIYQKQKNKKTLVKGWRLGRSLQNRIVSRVFEFLSWVILGVRANEVNAQPKLFPGELADHLTEPPDTFALDLYLLYKAQKEGYAVKTFNVHFPDRIHGVSHWAAHFLSRYKTIFGILRYMCDLLVREGRA